MFFICFAINAANPFERSILCEFLIRRCFNNAVRAPLFPFIVDLFGGITGFQAE